MRDLCGTFTVAALLCAVFTAKTCVVFSKNKLNHDKCTGIVLYNVSQVSVILFSAKHPIKCTVLFAKSRRKGSLFKIDVCFFCS